VQKLLWGAHRNTLALPKLRSGVSGFGHGFCHEVSRWMPFS
jgi:hypothetical protein